MTRPPGREPSIFSIIGRGELSPALFETRNPPLMGMSSARQTVDALDHLHKQNLGLLHQRDILFYENLIPLVSFFVLHLHVRDDLHRLRERFVPFGETVQTFVNVHLVIVYRGGADGAGLANFATSIGTFG